MHFPTIVVSLLLPLVAVAEEYSTVTSTSYQTLTKTITLVKTSSSAVAYSNSSISFYPTHSSNLTSSLAYPTASPTKSLEPEPSRAGAASIFAGANVVVVAMAGAAAVVLL